MRRIILVLALTLLLVVVAVEGTAIAQGPIEKGCTGILNAFYTQKDNANTGPSQAGANSNVDFERLEHKCGF
jgi:hypothetical protein